MTQPVHTFTEHLAAVKAIAWSPHHHGLLASGGGTADRCIRFWNTLTGQVSFFSYNLQNLMKILVESCETIGFCLFLIDFGKILEQFL